MSESQQKAEEQAATVVNSKDKKFIFLRKRKFWLYSLVLIIIVSGIIFYFVWHSRQSSTVAVCTTRSNSIILQQAGEAIIASNVAGQQQAVEKIQKLPNYQKDPNCLYVVVNYYISKGDTQNSSQYFAKLQSVYNPKQGFSKIFVIPKSIATLQSNITVMKLQAKEQKQHTTTFSNPSHAN